MAIVATDWEVDRSTKVISYTGDDHDGGSPSYATVIQLHRWLQDLADDPFATPSTNDHVDISALIPSDRSTDNIITLLNGYTVDPRAPEHLYDGSIVEAGGDTIYDGIVNYGNASVQVQIMQNGQVLADDWWNYNGAGLNADAAQGISHRFMLKVRDQGVDIDGRKLLGMCRTYNSTDGYTFKEFSINGTSRGNNVLALEDADDINNETAVGTVAGYTTVTNTEGLRLIDVNNDGTDEEYWSEWNRDTYTINQFYERMKWLTKAPIAEDEYAVTAGNDVIVDNATITGAAQSFANGSNAMLVTKVAVYLKVGAGSPTGNITASIYSHSGTFGTSSVPNTQTGSSSDPIDSTTLTSTYERTVFHFPTPVSLTASTNYCLVIEHPDGTAGAYISISNDNSTPSHGGNRAHNTAGWTAVAGEDLGFEVFTSPQINGIPGIWMRGVTHSMPYDAETGLPAVTTNDELVWGTNIDCPTNSGTFLVGEAVHEDTAIPAWKGRVLAWDPTNDNLMIYLDSGTVTAADTFTGQDSSATGTVNTFESPQAGSSGGMLRIYAFDDDGSAGNIYGQLMKGGTPSDNDKLYDATDLTDSYTLSANPTARTISTPFCGSSTGSAIIGSYGFGIEYADLSKDDKITALDGTTRTPPNLVTNSVSGLVITGSDEDYVFVAPWDGTSTDVNGDPAVNTNQMLVSTALTTDDVASVIVKTGDETAIPSDTPSAGWIRVVDNNGYHRRLKYSSWTGTTFTIDTTWHTANDSQNDFASVNASVDNHVYITYLDEEAQTATESYQAVHTAGTRNLVVVVRNGKTSVIKQFIAEWSFTSIGQTINAIHTTDT